MLAVITRWRERRRFRRDRDLFTFYDGRRHRAIDPMAAWRAWHSDPDSMGEAAAAGNDPEYSLGLAAISRTLGVPIYDSDSDDGLTETELLTIFERYMDYVDELKKKLGHGAISSPNTEPEFSTTPEGQAATTN